MNRGNAFFKFAAVTCIPLYIIFTFISHLYNTKINPMTNWLSDFGNPVLNPSGVLYYNMGCIIVATLLVIFYIGIFQWYMNRKIPKKYTICYLCAQISGVISSVFLVLASIFPLGTHTGLHSTFSTYHMIWINCFMSFTAVAFLMNRGMKKWIGVAAFLVAIFNIITTNAFSSLYIAEWIYFLLFMGYLAAITLNYDLIMQYANESEEGRPICSQMWKSN